MVVVKFLIRCFYYLFGFLGDIFDYIAGKLESVEDYLKPK
jgi:hypothetical protein